MDVDAPNLLKRCSSAPLINEASPTAVTSPTTSTAPRDTSCFTMFSSSNQHRTRRFSASFSPLATHSQNSFSPRLTPRVSQLRQEECADVSNTREVAHEREVHSAMQMSQSWEDLTIMPGGLGGAGAPMSPTRPNRFSPGVSPSPTRKAFATRRSLSPIAVRPSCLSPVNRPSGLVPPIKRRFDLDDAPSAKRSCWSTDRLTPSTPGTPDSLIDSPSGFVFTPISSRVQPMQESQESREENHKPQNPS